MNLIESRLLARLDWLKHGFGVGPGDVRDLVTPPSTVFDTEQVHGNAVHVLDDEAGDRILNGDAFVTSKSGLVCHVRTADCVPILIADTKNKAVGAVHAGWKGTAQGVAGRTITMMGDRFGTNPSDCFAAIGPCICGSCYEVGEEVVKEIDRLGLECAWKLDDRHVDLGRANRELLERAGVPPQNIDILSHCTSCEPRFASWRRNRSEGRQISYIVINQ